MVRDITEGIRGCSHCQLANHASHEAQVELQTLACDTPFDVVFLDIWSPGQITDKEHNLKVITMLDCMTGFAAATFLRGPAIDSQDVAMASFAAFFIPFGIPRLIIVDDDGLFKGVFQATFQQLQMPILPVSPENHKACRNERFHRYLNKVQKINSADTGTLEQWKQGTLFAVYNWNAGPIDGTDIPRSVAAIGREFPFPIDLVPALPRKGTSEGQQVLDHLDSVSPLLYKQRQLLDILNAERRQRHIELRNEGIKTTIFSPGDLVIVRKQVKSDTAAGVSAKLVFRSKGPYRVIERIGETHSYRIQKLPFLQGMGIPGRIVKENAARMEKLPSTLVLHKRTDGADSRFAAMHRDLSNTPLQKWLGIPRYGGFQQAADDPAWAFVPLASMWGDHTVEEDSSDDEQEEEHLVQHLERQELPVESSQEEIPEPTIQQEEAPEDPTIEPPALIPPRRILNRLYRDIEDSMDKLFFLRIQGTNMWRLAQVDLNETNPYAAKHYGQYRVHWWTAASHDRSHRMVRECRFAPDVCTIRADQSLGKRHPVKPERITAALESDPTIRWMGDTVNITEDRIAGPFNFCKVRIGLRGPKRQAVSEAYHIDATYRAQLEQRGPEMGVHVENIRSEVTDPESL